MIKEKTGVTRIDAEGEVFSIIGPPEAVAMAELAIRELIEKGYMSLAYENFTADFATVHPSSFPDIIGKQGAVIQKIKAECKVEIDIPSVPKNPPENKKFKISLVGSGEAVEKAKAVIESIVMYYHHEITHPGLVHEELDIQEWNYRFLIGRGGSEMRHIQNNYQVKVYIPRAGKSMNPKVVVVGERKDVDRAMLYIEKMLWQADQPKGRDRPDGAAAEEEEEDHEPWMDQYLYKRK